MNVLFLTPQLPFPQTSGGAIKSFKLVEHLSKSHQVTIASLLKSDDDKKNLHQFLKVIPNVSVSSHFLLIERTLTNLIKSYFSGVPLTIFRNLSPEFKKEVELLTKACDVIFVDHYLMFQYIPKSFNGRIIVHQHNAEFIMWSRMAKQTINPLKKLVLSLEAHRIKKYEVLMCNKANAVLAAPNDQVELKSAGVKTNVFIDTYHLGNEENLHLPAIKYDNTQLNLLFIGTLTWEANIDGLLWFLKECWPLIKAQLPQVKFTVVGKCSDELKQRILLLAPEIDLLGFVDNLDELYQSHRVFVAPLRFGSGIKVKVVNGLYRGIPTVTTSVGAEGLNLNNGEELFIADNKTEFSKNIISLLNNIDIWHPMSLKSRAIMRKKYTWKNVMDNVDRSFNND